MVGWVDLILGCERNLVANMSRWHVYDAEEWNPVFPTASDVPNQVIIATWNIDAFTAASSARTAAILDHVLSQEPRPSIIFLQEVNAQSVSTIHSNQIVRESFYSSQSPHVDTGIFTTVTLISKDLTPSKLNRVPFESRFQRDALCCDVKVGNGALRLVNVHLDSLAYTPSLRPGQLSLAAGMLKKVQCGLVAGDFNPVLPEDGTLVEENELVDAWKELRPDEEGYTWGVDGKASFPANRMDKIAVWKLKPTSIRVMHPGSVGEVPWSDHSGLYCTLELP